MRLRKAVFLLPGLATVLLVASLLADGERPIEPEMFAPFPHPKGYVCYRATSPITIDGKINDPAWDAAPWTDAFVDIEGDKQPKPRYRTRAKLLWDDEALYIAAELEEPHVWGNQSEHDCIIFEDNDFEVFLGPNGDDHLYGELELNARNTTWDLLLTKPYKDGGKPLNAWEILGLKTAVHVQGTLNDPSDKDTGWTVEIKWPWAGLKELTDLKTLTYPPKNGSQCRINFSRVEWDMQIVAGKYQKVPNRPEHNWVWSPQGVIDMHRPERWGYLQFSTAKPGQDQFHPDPYWSTRDLLHRVYYSQRAYHKTNGKYAKTLPELGLKETANLSMETTRSGFEISVPLAAEGARPRRMTINNEAKLWTD